MPFDFLSNPILNRDPGALARDGTELHSTSKHHHHIFSSITTVPIAALSSVKLAIS